MKRLLSILLMNAWGGLRRKASLPTLSMVGASVMVLLVASTVTADASPHTSIPVVSQVASIVREGIANTPLSTMLVGPSSRKPVSVNPKVDTNSDRSSSQQSGNNTANSNPTGTSGSSSSNTNTSSASGQTTAQPTAATLTLSSLQCTPNQSTNTYGVNVANAKLNLQSPLAADGALTYEWDVRADSGTNAGQVTPGASTSQPMKAGTSNVTLANADQSPLYSTNSTNSSFSFRLHVTSPVDVMTSWFSVPQSTDGSCPQTN